MKTASRPLLRRLLHIDRAVRAGEYPTARSLAEGLEVHVRTVRRDLDFLRCSWDAPLVYSGARKGYHYTDPDYALPLVRLTEGELLALFLAERVLEQYRGTPCAEHLAATFDKVTLALPEEVSVDLSHWQGTFSARGPGGPDISRDVVKPMLHSLVNQTQLEILYASASSGSAEWRVIDPYHLTSVSGEWYLIAFCHRRREVRMFVPGRIREVRERDHTFERPPSFDVNHYLDHSFGVIRGAGEPVTVTLRFSPELARHLRAKQWHPSQQSHDEEDGSLRITVRVNHLLEVKRWAMSYGAECEVLEPEELRQQIRAELVQMSSYYESEEPKRPKLNHK